MAIDWVKIGHDYWHGVADSITSVFIPSSKGWIVGRLNADDSDAQYPVDRWIVRH